MSRKTSNTVANEQQAQNSMDQFAQAMKRLSVALERIEAVMESPIARGFTNGKR